jgi:hypothetical protein
MEEPDASDLDSGDGLDPVEFSWRYLRELSERERELSRELDEVRDELYEQARAMKNAGLASVVQIAEALDRNRQRVNSWMHAKPSSTGRDKQERDPDWVDPEGHVQF